MSGLPRSLTNPIELFICYARRDEKLCDQLKTHIATLVRQGIISIWREREISVGAEWKREVNMHINYAQVILVLISPDFIASEYAYSGEMARAIERHKMGEACVIPIILRPAIWEDASFGMIQALPTNRRPVTSWSNRDEAWANIARGIELVCEELLKSSKLTQQTPVETDGSLHDAQQTLKRYELHKVFVKSGVPSVTFIEREDFGLLKLSLAQPGRGVVIEGPSGVGKTSALKKAVEELVSPDTVEDRKMISARDPEDRSKLQTLRQWHNGTVIIDEFHRLGPALCSEIVDYLKYLADTELPSKKLVIVGIPQTGQTLVDSSFDVATRIDVFRLGFVSDGLILSMIEAGEKALNIVFDRKAEIALAANGSLNIAQYLCFNICSRNGVTRTQDRLLVIHCDIDTEVRRIMVDLRRKFGESVKRLAAMGGYRDSTCLRLLEELANSEDGFLSLPILKATKPDLARGIEQFIRNGWMPRLYHEYPESKNYLFFNQTTDALIIDDPQLTFYLRKTQFSGLAKEVGKIAEHTRKRIFVSYSHKDAKWLERLQVHLTPIEREGIIDLWDDTKIASGAEWKQEIQAAIESATVAVLLVSADFLASEFIFEYELPQILLRAEAGGTTILPIIIAPCLFTGSGLDVYQAMNSLHKPLVAMGTAEQEQTLVNVAMIIRDRLVAEEL